MSMADVASRNSDVQPVKLFTAKGRIGRLRYLAFTMIAYLLFVVGVIVLNLLFEAMVSSNPISLGTTGVALLGYVIFVALLTIQRSHDMGWSGWTAILAFIPFVGLIWLFGSGTAGNNRYGAPTPPNTWLVVIGGLVFPIIAAVGILAAIALPAYQDYVNRAKAAQVHKP